MSSFAGVADLEAFLQVEITTAAQVAAAERALAEATAAIQNYCRQTLSLVEDDEVTLDVFGAGDRLFLPELPVAAVSAVVEDGKTLAAGADYALGQYGILHRLGGARWARGVQVVTVTYSHGYGTLPDDIVAVCVRAASRAYQAGLRAAESDAVMGVTSKQLGDFSVSYTAETGGGGIGEGVMGASAARMLLLSEKDLLNRYRLRGA